MEYISGNIFIRVPQDGMHKDTMVLGHMHNFDHTTYVQRGGFEICLLDVTKVNANGHPLESTVLQSRIIWSTDTTNWVVIKKGKYHTLRALEDGSVYHCIYAHQMPQALSMDPPGALAQLPYTKRDADGTLWVRVDEKVVQDSNGWAEAYR